MSASRENVSDPSSEAVWFAIKAIKRRLQKPNGTRGKPFWITPHLFTLHHNTRVHWINKAWAFHQKVRQPLLFLLASVCVSVCLCVSAYETQTDRNSFDPFLFCRRGQRRWHVWRNLILRKQRKSILFCFWFLSRLISVWGNVVFSCLCGSFRF